MENNVNDILRKGIIKKGIVKEGIVKENIIFRLIFFLFFFFFISLVFSVLSFSDSIYCPSFEDIHKIHDNNNNINNNNNNINNNSLIIINSTFIDNLQVIIDSADEYSTILLEDGIYDISQLTIAKRGITLRSRSGVRESVILDGNYKAGKNILSIKAPDVSIADITIKRSYYHPIHVSGGADNVSLYNLHIIDGREQFVKVNPDYDLNMNDYGLLACSLLELTDAGRQKIQSNPTPGFKCYTGGIDVHKAEGWTVRDNIFKNIYCTNGGLSEHAIHFWSQSKDTKVYRNIIENCARGIGFGLGSNGATRDYNNNPYQSVSGYIGHIDGEIYNNIIFVEDNIKQYYDTGISLEQAYGAKVYHNTLPSQPTWSSIDYRFSNTYADIANNIVYKITARNGGQAILSKNLENDNIEENYFVNYNLGNYQLTLHAKNAIDTGTDVSIGKDILGNKRDKNPDIGAYEYMNKDIKECIIKVGSAREIKTPSQANNIATDGCIIEIDAGLYRNDIVQWTQNNLIIRGIGGHAHLDATGFRIPNQKAIWVIKGDNTTIENIEFSGAAVSDKNGAGIRQEGTNLIVRNCSFHDNEMGILTGKDLSSEVIIEYSEFRNHGKSGGGFSHNIYIGTIKKFTIRYSYSHHAQHGHNIKSRAYENYILYNRIEDGGDGYSSYLIDIPNGGNTFIIGNAMQQGPKAENYHAISYAAEGAINPEQGLYFASNTIINQRSNGRGIRYKGNPYVKVVNNIFNGFQTENIIVGTPDYYGHNIEDANLSDEDDSIFHLYEGSSAIDSGNAYGIQGGYLLDPEFEYVHPLGKKARVLINNLDIGAYEYLSEINEVLSHDNNFTKIYVGIAGSDNTGDGTEDNPFKSVKKAASIAKAGSEIIIKSGIYSGGEYIRGLSGTESAPIIIRGENPNDKPVFSGKTEGFHFTDVQNIIIMDIKVKSSSGNGINIDDGGDYKGIINNLLIEGVVIHNIGTGGNQDCLKLSGLNNVTLKNNEFYKCGGQGFGSAIDMVGCHNITIQENYLHDTDGTGIQAKGGSEDIIIRRNKFKDAGVRAINMGGSTGLDFFRPSGVDFEAKNIRVYGNIFMGSDTPIAYTGCVGCKVYNNLLYMPERWIFRILQESVDGYIPVKEGEFVNNIIYFSKDQIRSYVNIGPNTDSDSFIVKNNLFYSTNGDISDIDLPGTKQNNYLGIDPMLRTENDDFKPEKDSPVWDKGLLNSVAIVDYRGIDFSENISIGHFAFFEISKAISYSDNNELEDITVEVDDFDSDVIIKYTNEENSILNNSIFNNLILNNTIEKIKVGVNRTKGTIIINETGGDYLFYIIKNKVLVDNIDNVLFSKKPFKITDSEVIFLLDKRENIHTITYSIENNILSNTTGLNSEAYARNLKIEDKVEVYSQRILQIIKILLVFAVIGIGFGLIYYYFRGRQE